MELEGAGAVVTGSDDEEIIVGSRNAMVYRTSLADIRTLGRITQGVKVMTKLAEDDVVISMSAFRERTWEDFERLPKVQPKKARSQSNNGHAPTADMIGETLGGQDGLDAEDTSEPEDAADADASDAEGALDIVDVDEASDAEDANDDAESDDTPSGAEPIAVADDAPDATKDADAGKGGGDMTVSMWHAMQAPLFPEAEETEEDDA